MRFSDRVAIVTGSARGIGRAIATGFARDGAKVIIADLRADLADVTAAALRDEGMQAQSVVVDVGRVEDIERMVGFAVAKFGRLDILCNNAGVGGGGADFFEATEADWDRILTINLKSAFLASRAAARVMRDSGRGGAILNTSSTSGFISSSRPTVAYDVSKAGLRQMTTTLGAHLVEYGIRVNAIAPGTIDTDLGAGLQDPVERRARLEKRAQERIPMKRIGQPEDLVGAATFLCSDAAAYITGHTLVVDGGILAR